MSTIEEIMSEELRQFYSDGDEYHILVPPSNGVLVVAHKDDGIPVTVVILDDLVNTAIVKWGVMDTGRNGDNRVWSTENEALADAFVNKNPTWTKVRRLIIDSDWTDV